MKNQETFPGPVQVCGKTNAPSSVCEHCVNPETCTLNKLGIGCRGFVVSVKGDPEVRRRLLEMGFCAGTHIEVIRRAPLGDPIEFRLRGYHLSLRDEQARYVQVLPN